MGIKDPGRPAVRRTEEGVQPEGVDPQFTSLVDRLNRWIKTEFRQFSKAVMDA